MLGMPALTGYRVWRNDGTGFTEIENDSGDTGKEYTDTATLADGTYWYVVAGVNSDGAGDYPTRPRWRSATWRPTAPPTRRRPGGAAGNGRRD